MLAALALPSAGARQLRRCRAPSRWLAAAVPAARCFRRRVPRPVAWRRRGRPCGLRPSARRARSRSPGAGAGETQSRRLAPALPSRAAAAVPGLVDHRPHRRAGHRSAARRGHRAMHPRPTRRDRSLTPRWPRPVDQRVPAGPAGACRASGCLPGQRVPAGPAVPSEPAPRAARLIGRPCAGTSPAEPERPPDRPQSRANPSPRSRPRGHRPATTAHQVRLAGTP